MLAQAETTGTSGGIWITVILFGAVFYFLMVRPQRSRVRRQQSLASSLEVGDQIRTVGGMFGVVIGINQDSVVLGIDEGRVRIAMGAIAARLTNASDGSDEDADEA